tara:strand:- start:234 stop:461 length:228 start_codon:yes stop_codon:yes gene_type:complete
MNRIRRLTSAIDNVITTLFGGRRSTFRGDSKTPFMRYEEENFLNNEHLHYSNRHGLHLNPQKSVEEKSNKNKGNV